MKAPADGSPRTLSDREQAEILIKRTRQEALRDYLSQQVAAREAAQAVKEQHERAFAQSQQAQYEEWKSEEAADKVYRRARQDDYREQLAVQNLDDQQRKLNAKTLRSLGLTGSIPAHTIKDATGRLTPYVLQDRALLSPICATIRFDVVNALDGTTITRPKKKGSQHFIE
mmetsp:Transcript_236/g.374  ORF Transcript_236/g.374 Transcript_236/m.374 type:complete len:171 (-) Transcript_236:451-963(-)